MEPDERRAAILRAARELFSRHAYAAVSVADIAGAAGVSPPLVVFYYGTKRALYLAVVDSASETLRAGLREVPGPPSLERLAASVRFYAEYARTHRTGFLSFVRSSHERALPEAAVAADRLRTEVAARILADLAATRESPAPSDATLAVAVHGYLGYVDAAITHWLALPAEQREQVSTDTIADLAVGAFTGCLAAVNPPMP